MQVHYLSWWCHAKLPTSANKWNRICFWLPCGTSLWNSVSIFSINVYFNVTFFMWTVIILWVFFVKESIVATVKLFHPNIVVMMCWLSLLIRTKFEIFSNRFLYHCSAYPECIAWLALPPPLSSLNINEKFDISVCIQVYTSWMFSDND